MNPYEAITLRRRLTEADLLSGCEELARMAKEGLPAVLREAGAEAPSVVLKRLCGLLTPGDFTAGAGALWGAAAPAWEGGASLTLDMAMGQVPLQDRDMAEQALTFVREHGMGLPYTAPVAAARLLALGSCLEVLRHAQALAASKLDEAQAVFDGVV